MMGSSHALGGAAAWLACCAAFPPAPAAVVAGTGLAVAGALAVDIDHRRSEVTRGLGPAGWLLFHLTRPRCGGFRGAVHSLWGLAAAGVLAGAACLAWGWPAWAVLAALTGWASHLVLDACTKEGLPLGWPRRARWGWLPARRSLVTGGHRRRRGRRRPGRWLAEEGERLVFRPLLAAVALACGALLLWGGHL